MSRNAFILSLALVALVGSALLISSRFESIAMADETEHFVEQEKQDTKPYTVRAGDNLYRLSQSFYGNPRLWETIAKANNMKSPVDLKAGQTIKIPVLSMEEISTSTEIREIKDAPSPLEMRPDVDMTAQADGFDSNQPYFSDSMHFSSDTFESVHATIVPMGKDATLKVTAVVGDFHQELFNESIRPFGGDFRYAFTKDTNNDGKDEIFTVWSVGNDDFFTKEIAWNGSRFEHTATHPNAPFAQSFEPEGFQNLNDKIERAMKTGAWND